MLLGRVGGTISELLTCSSGGGLGGGPEPGPGPGLRPGPGEAGWEDGAVGKMVSIRMALTIDESIRSDGRDGITSTIDVRGSRSRSRSQPLGLPRAVAGLITATSPSFADAKAPPSDIILGMLQRRTLSGGHSGGRRTGLRWICVDMRRVGLGVCRSEARRSEARRERTAVGGDEANGGRGLSRLGFEVRLDAMVQSIGCQGMGE